MGEKLEEAAYVESAPLPPPTPPHQPWWMWILVTGAFPHFPKWIWCKLLDRKLTWWRDHFLSPLGVWAWVNRRQASWLCLPLKTELFPRSWGPETEASDCRWLSRVFPSVLLAGFFTESQKEFKNPLEMWFSVLKSEVNIYTNMESYQKYKIK